MTNSVLQQREEMIKSLQDSFAERVGSLLPDDIIDKIVSDTMSENDVGMEVMRDAAKMAMKEVITEWFKKNDEHIKKAVDTAISDLDPSKIVVDAVAQTLTANLAQFAGNISYNLESQINSAINQAIAPVSDVQSYDCHTANANIDLKISTAINNSINTDTL